MVWLHHLFGHPHVIQAARAHKVAEPELGKERLDVCKACRVSERCWLLGLCDS